MSAKSRFQVLATSAVVAFFLMVNFGVWHVRDHGSIFAAFLFWNALAGTMLLVIVAALSGFAWADSCDE